jgi:hypothetical protein
MGLPRCLYVLKALQLDAAPAACHQSVSYSSGHRRPGDLLLLSCPDRCYKVASGSMNHEKDDGFIPSARQHVAWPHPSAWTTSPSKKPRLSRWGGERVFLLGMTGVLFAATALRRTTHPSAITVSLALSKADMRMLWMHCGSLSVVWASLSPQPQTCPIECLHGRATVTWTMPALLHTGQ